MKCRTVIALIADSYDVLSRQQLSCSIILHSLQTRAVWRKD
jgi:hypothetical protein